VTYCTIIMGTVPLEQPEVKCLDQGHNGGKGTR